jgi:hypothetical protein
LDARRRGKAYNSTNATQEIGGHLSEELVNAVNKVEDIILIALSCSDRDILADYVSEQLSLATNKMVQDGLEKILKQIKKGWTDIEDSPYALSVQYFGKNIFTLTPFQNRVAHLQETADQVKIIFDSIYDCPKVSDNGTLIFLVKRISNGFYDMLGEGINFKGLQNNDSYYESHKTDYATVVEVHKEFVRRDCQLLRELFEEI